MKKWILPIVILLSVSMMFISCVNPDAKMKVSTPEPKAMKTERPSGEVTPAPEVNQPSDEGEETPADDQQSSEDQNEIENNEAVDDAEAALNEVVDLLDELDSILDESFEE